MFPPEYTISRNHLFQLIAGTCVIGLCLFGLGYLAGRDGRQPAIAPPPSPAIVAESTSAPPSLPGMPPAGQAAAQESSATPPLPAARETAASGGEPTPEAGGVQAPPSAGGGPSDQPQSTVQIAASASQQGAEKLARQLAAAGIDAYVEQTGNRGDKYPYRVKAGPFPDDQALETCVRRLKEKGYKPLVLRKR